MRSTLIVIAVLVLAGCGDDGKVTTSAGTAATIATSTKPSSPSSGFDEFCKANPGACPDENSEAEDTQPTPPPDDVQPVRSALGTAVARPPKNTAPCRDGLTIRTADAYGPMTGEHNQALVITNRSPRRCWLRGYPTVALFSGGHRLRFRIAHGGVYAGEDRPRTIVLAPGNFAWMKLGKYRCDGLSVATADLLRIRLPGGTREHLVDLPESHRGVMDLTLCGGGPSTPGNTVEVSPVRRR